MRGPVDSDGISSEYESDVEYSVGNRTVHEWNKSRDDDEEIDSDEAFGSSDDEQTGRRGRRASQSDQSDDEPESDCASENGWVDLSTALALNNSDSESLDDNQQVEFSDIDEDADEADDEGHAALKAALSQFDRGSKANKGKKLSSFSLPESEYSVPLQAGKLQLQDVLSSTASTADKNLRKALDMTQKFRSQGGKLAPSLPRNIRQKVDQAKAFEITAKEVSRWQDTVKNNREASHLQFPLVSDLKEFAKPSITAPLRSNDQGLTSKIYSALQESGLASEAQAEETNELEAQNPSLEDATKRRAELRMLRELMFRESRKAKRLKKIKSKTYHRIHKREKDRALSQLQEGDENGIDYETRRAEERMSQKHKHSGKNHGENLILDDKPDIENELDRQEKLQEELAIENDSNTSDDGNSDDEKDIKLAKRPLFAMKFMQEKDQQSSSEEEESEKFADDGLSGRIKFGPALAIAKKSISTSEPDRGKRDSKAKGKTLKSAEPQIINTIKEKDDEVNPWIISGHGPKRQKVDTRHRPREEQLQDETGKTSIIDSQKFLAVNKDQALAPEGWSSESEEFDENIKPENALVYDKGKAGKHQRELVKQAFAGDNVVRDIDIVSSDNESDNNAGQGAMPGWGSWGRSENRKKRRAGRLQESNASKKKLHKPEKVHITQKKSKKNSVFTAKQVPYPYETVDQYERAMRMALGQEWTARETFQNALKPRVLVKQGLTIQPIKKPMQQ